VTAQYMIAPTTPSTIPSTKMLVPVVRLIRSSFRGVTGVYPRRRRPQTPTFGRIRLRRMPPTGDEE
jgi:hypothetical protein